MNDAIAPADEEWNAGDLGCGELVLELRERIGRLRPGQVIKLIARDPGAPADMPAWCRMTGHTLVLQDHPVYLIRRERPPGADVPDRRARGRPDDKSGSWP